MARRKPTPQAPLLLKVPPIVRPQATGADSYTPRPGINATGASGPLQVPNVKSPAGAAMLPGTDGIVVVPPGIATSRIELGLSGLKRFSGHVYEEFLPQLFGNKSLQTYREMADNDAIVGALLFAIEMLIRQIEWHVETEGTDAASVEAREFIEQCLNDMSSPWEETLGEILSMLTYGFSFHEICYKQRSGNASDFGGGETSLYDDGKIGWRKWAIRAQETRWAWQFAPDGAVQGMWQNSPPDYHNVFIPIEKALLFRPRQHKGNPEGRSILRTAYRSYWFLKRMQEIEGIGVERDLAGLPVIEVPAEITMATATSDQQAVFQAMQAAVSGVRRDALEGLVMPCAYDAAGNKLFDFKLMTTGGARQFNTDTIVQRYETRITQSVLADFVMLGHVRVGTQNLSETKDEMFSRATNTWCKQIASVVNRYAIPRLLALNGMTPKQLPTLEPQALDVPSLKDLAPFVAALAQAGMPLFPDANIENRFRDLLDVPPLTDEEFAEREAADAEQQQQDHEQALAEFAAAKAQANGQPQQVKAPGMGPGAKEPPATPTTPAKAPSRPATPPTPPKATGGQPAPDAAPAPKRVR
mgnify:CR=1 FL=1